MWACLEVVLWGDPTLCCQNISSPVQNIRHLVVAGSRRCRKALPNQHESKGATRRCCDVKGSLASSWQAKNSARRTSARASSAKTSRVGQGDQCKSFVALSVGFTFSLIIMHPLLTCVCLTCVCSASSRQPLTRVYLSKTSSLLCLLSKKPEISTSMYSN